MDKVRGHFLNKKHIFSTLAIIAILSLLAHIIYINLQKYDLGSKISQIRDGSEFSLGVMTDFHWDLAYLDYENYTKAKSIIKEHRLRGYVSGNISNPMVRVVFVRNGMDCKNKCSHAVRRHV